MNKNFTATGIPTVPQEVGNPWFIGNTFKIISKVINKINRNIVHDQLILCRCKKIKITKVV